MSGTEFNRDRPKTQSTTMYDIDRNKKIRDLHSKI
jgi:hypothetical protein